MIIQGSNSPLVLTVPSSSLPMSNVHVGLYSGNTEIKHWGSDELTISGTSVSCPLTQQETLAFPAGRLDIEMKWLNSSGEVCFSEDAYVMVIERRDKDVLGS